MHPSPSCKLLSTELPLAAHVRTLCALLILSALGCQDGGIKTYHVEGTLKYAGTEETIPGAGIELRPENPGEGQYKGSIVGRVRVDGKIQVTTFEVGDGVPAGTHRVMLTEPPFPEGWDMDTQGPPPAKIPRKYRSYRTSEITVKVGPDSENRLDIVIEKPGR